MKNNHIKARSIPKQNITMIVIAGWTSGIIFLSTLYVAFPISRKSD